MKLLINLLILVLGFAVSAQAQPGRDDVEVRDLVLRMEGDSLRVRFRAAIGVNATRGHNYKLTLQPVLVSGDSVYPLRRLEIYGRRVELLDARGGIYVRGLTDADLRQPVAGSQHVMEGDTVAYSATVPLESWMNGAGLRLERWRSGCCRQERLSEVVLAEAEAPVELSASGVAAWAGAVSAEGAATTTGDSLSRRLTFVEPFSALEARMHAQSVSPGLFDPDMPLDMGQSADTPRQQDIDKYIADGEDGALMVHFHQGRHDLERHFRGNNATLVNLVSSIRLLMSSPTSRVVRVVVVGSASPEGTLAFNDRLAWNRAVTLKEFLLRNTDFPSDSITLFNGSEDWRGLRRLVAASDLYEREEILRIIDNVPVRKGRELELMKLSGGRPYLYMLEHMFPDLRNAAFIKVYYENLPDPSAEALSRGAALVSAGRYAEALSILPQATPGSRRDLLQGTSLLFTGDRDAALPLLERAAAAGESEAESLLAQIRAVESSRTFGPVVLPGKK